jgi:hypothetical protein
MPFLNWISDTDLIHHTRSLVVAAQQARVKKQREFHKNVIDPFQAIFEMSGYPMNSVDWGKAELARQVGKTVQNKIGEFHQNLLGSVANWDNLGTGQIVDLRSTTNRIIAEVKNKHNTVTGSKKVDVYDQLEGLVMPNASIYNGYEAYFVNIIPKNSTRYNRPFTPPDNTTKTNRSSNALIREIDGASFYHTVTGDQSALRDLYLALPNVIDHILGGTQLSNTDKIRLYRYFAMAYS